MNLNGIQLDKQKKILIVIFCVLFLYTDISFILKKQISGVKSWDSKIARLKKDLIDLNRALADLRVSSSRQGLTVKTTVKSSKILSEGQVPGLLQDISSLANKFEIKIGQISPSREVPNAKKVLTSDKFMPILINLNLICDYHNLGKFIAGLESFPVFLTVQELKISSQLPDYFKQRVNLVLKTYVTK